MVNKIRLLLFMAICLTLCSCVNSTTPSNPVESSCQSLTLDPESQVVYSYVNNGTHTGGDYSDVPVRPFLVGNLTNPIVMWFASNSTGYCKSIGLPVSESVSDILAQIRRVPGTESDTCATWVTSRFNTESPTQYPVNTYYNELWMEVPFTLDGVNIYSLIHNEYHLDPENTTDVYGNLVGATSTDGANTFNLYQAPGESTSNLPVIVAPYPYNNVGKGGMWAQTNIIHWGNYYYMLVNQLLDTIESSAPPSGICIYRTPDISSYNSWLGWNAVTNSYDIPLVPSYPSNLSNPTSYLCSPIPGLSYNFSFSWSYNVALNKFILIGINPSYNNIPNNYAFVYTLANLNPDSGGLSSATGSTLYTEYLLGYITSIQQWVANESSLTAQFYPSILDPNSPTLSDSLSASLITPGDRNFQYSGSESMFLYYTELYPVNESNPHGYNRDIYRQHITYHNCPQ